MGARRPQPTTRRITAVEWSRWGPDRRAVELATRQHGRVRTDQLLAAGLTRDAIKARVRKGLLFPEHRGVFVMGHLAAPPLGREAGAVLAAGDRATLSGGSAAWVHRLTDLRPVVVELTVPPYRRVRRPGMTIHRRQLTAADVATVDGLRTTTPLRTLVDLRPRVDHPTFERMVGEAHGRRLVPFEVLRELLGGDPQISRSRAEWLLLRLIRRAGLPEPRLNAPLGPWKIDALWSEQRVALELDSWAWHALRRNFERDRRKDRAMRAAGLTPIRATASQLTGEPEAVVADLSAALARASWRMGVAGAG